MFFYKINKLTGQLEVTRTIPQTLHVNFHSPKNGHIMNQDIISIKTFIFRGVRYTHLSDPPISGW